MLPHSSQSSSNNMKTVGDLIQEARLSKNYSKEKLGEVTHIRTSFITAIEKADWEVLPEFAVTLGFVKSIAHFLDIPENQATSIFKREYPPKLRDSIELKGTSDDRSKEIGRKFMWGPRLTFLTAVLLIVLVVLGYLGFQYRRFNSPPSLTVNEPTQNEIVSAFTLVVKGKTEMDAIVLVNDQPVTTDSNGNFSTQIDVNTNTNMVKVIAKSRSGRVTTITRTIKVLP